MRMIELPPWIWVMVLLAAFSAGCAVGATWLLMMIVIDVASVT